MHLMYYVDEKGKRVYTLKVRTNELIIPTKRYYLIRYFFRNRFVFCLPFSYVSFLLFYPFRYV